MQRTRRSLDSIGCHRHTPSLRDNEGINASTFSGTSNCTKVADISETVQEDNKRRTTSFIEHRNKLLELRVFDLADKGDDSLVLLTCQTHQAFFWHDLYGNHSFLGQLRNMAHLATTQSALEQDSINLTTCLQGFN